MMVSGGPRFQSAEETLEMASCRLERRFLALCLEFSAQLTPVLTFIRVV
jgi:hypothetical protein